jgi:type II secretory pathway pseudopilin PulG
MVDRPTRVGPVGVIEGFAGRRSVIPFAILVLGLLATGLIILLLLNTAMDRGAFELQSAQRRQSQLTDQQQQLQLRLTGLSAPGALASEAAALGMVPNPRPVFLNPGNGAVLGVPTQAPTTAVPKQSPTQQPPTQSPTPSTSGSATASPTVSATASPSTSGTRP